MPRPPVPYPFDFSQQAATVIVPKASMLDTTDPSWTYVAENPGTYPDPGWFSTNPVGIIANVDGFRLGSGVIANQHYERTFTPAGFPGLAPNKIVRVQGIMDWYRYTFAVNSEARVFVVANGVTSFNIPENLLSGGVGQGPAPFNLVVACDGSGNLKLEFGIYLEDGNGSTSIGATLVEMEVLSIVADPWDIIIDSAVMFHNGTTPISISREGFRFERRATYEEYDFPGKVAPVYLGDELLNESPALIGKFMNVGEAPFLVYEPGGTWSSTQYDRTLSQAALRTALSAGMYLSDVRCVWRLLTGGFLQVRFPKALCRSYDIGSADKNEGELPVIIEARQDLSAAITPKTSPIFFIDRMPSTWAPVP